VALGTDVSGTLLAAQFPALTGDVTTTAGALATTLANVGTAGTYGQVTTNAKGLVSSGTVSNDVAHGGTGLTGGTSGGVLYFSSSSVLASSGLLTNHAMVVGGGAGNPPFTLAALTNGQLYIGSTGVDPVPATLTAGSNITITPGAGTITIAALAGTVTGSGASGQDTYWSGASVLGGEATIIHAKSHGLATAGTAAANKTAMNAAIAACNAAGGCRLILPGGSYTINAGLTGFTAAAVVEGVGGFSSATSGTVFSVSGSGTLFTVTTVPVWFKHFFVSGGTTAIAFSGIAGGGIDGLWLAGQTTPITLVNSNQYILRASTLVSYTASGIAISGTGTPQDSGDATIEGLTMNGSQNSIGLSWTGEGGLRFLNNKVLVQTGSTSAAIDVNAANGVITGDLLFIGNSIEGDYAYAFLFQSTGSGSYTNILINSNQLACCTSNILAANTANILRTVITGNTFWGGSSTIHCAVLNATDTYIGGNNFAGNGQTVDAISINAAATRTTVGANHFDSTITRNLVNSSTTTVVKGAVTTPISNLSSTMGNGSIMFCSDCVLTTNMATCSGSGTGSLATRINGVWKCQ